MGRSKGNGGKGFVVADWQVAYNIVYDNGIIPYLEVEPTSNEEFEYKEFYPVLPSRNNQEEELIKRDLLQHLSEEAKEIISLLFKSPAEVLESLMPPKYKGTSTEVGEKYSKELLRKKLISDGWKTKKINKVFSELRNLVLEMDLT